MNCVVFFFNCMTTSTIVFAMSAECTARWLKQASSLDLVKYIQNRSTEFTTCVSMCINNKFRVPIYVCYMKSHHGHKSFQSWILPHI